MSDATKQSEQGNEMRNLANNIRCRSYYGASYDARLVDSFADQFDAMEAERDMLSQKYADASVTVLHLMQDQRRLVTAITEAIENCETCESGRECCRCGTFKKLLAAHATTKGKE